MNRSLILALSLSVTGILTQFIFGIEGGMNQLGFTLVGIALYYLIVKKVDITVLINMQYVVSLVAVISLAALLVFGDPTRGSKRWFFVFGYGIQPSVVFVPFLLLSLTVLLRKLPLKKFVDVIRILLVCLIPIFLVFKQPDLGSSLVLAGTAFVALLSAHLKIRHIAVLFIIAVPILIATPRFLKPYQKDRLVSFLNPSHDQYGSNYNALQAEIAIGSGGLLGKGLFSGTQSRLAFLPEAHTDFVFASYTETFGFVGISILFTLYLLFFLTLLRPNYWTREPSLIAYYTAGIFGFIFVQFVFNVGMNLRLLPVVGVPLPFISYGGSSILAIYTLLGIQQKLREV